MDAPSKFPRDYWICAEAMVPQSDFKEPWINARINFSLKRSGKIVISTAYKDQIEAETDGLKIRAYMLLHLMSSVYEKIGIWPEEPHTEIHFLKSDSGRPLLDVKNPHSQIQFSMMKWVSPDWLEQPKVPAMARYLAKMKDLDPVTYTLFIKTRSYMLPESAKINWDINIF